MSPDEVRPQDDGSALVIALVAILLCSLIAVPTLRYAMTVIHSSQVVTNKSIRQEAVKGGLRVALADPIKLYDTCMGAGLTTAVDLASPGLSTNVTTQCFLMNNVTAEDPATLRSARAVTQYGAVAPVSTPIPAPYQGTSYTNSLTDANEWLTKQTQTSQFNRIWLPYLPAHALDIRSATPYVMPAGYMNTGFTSCTVYFPGTYTDALNIAGSTPVFFTSGVYYFENTIKISGNANVVVGDGAIDGCTTDQRAVFNAIDAPFTHNITGIGATWVLGAGASLTVDNSTAGNASLAFNRRYVATTDVSTAVSAGVSIESVNGRTSTTGSSDLLINGQIHIPLSKINANTDATTQSYKVSTLVPPALPAAAPTPIIDISMTSTATMKVSIPGYVSVPQGAVRINATSPANAANKTVQFGGGILAAQTIISAAIPPSTFLFGIDNPYTQKVFKIVSTSDGAPLVTSTAVVQVNSNGAYAVNSWSVQ